MIRTTQERLNRFNYLLGETEAAYHELSLKMGYPDSAMKVAVCDL